MLQLLLISLIVGSALAIPRFTEFQERFIEQTQLVQPRLVEFRAENNEQRLELIHVLLEDFANLTSILRQVTADTWEFVENHEDVNEVCLFMLREVFSYYVWISEVSIQYAAENVDYLLRYDAETRIYPRVDLMDWESIRAISRTVETLGRNQSLDNIGDTLNDELENYRSLWEETEEMLLAEVYALDPIAEMLQELIEGWYQLSKDWSETFRDMITVDIGVYCNT